MSLTPEKITPKLYRWDDEDAPRLQKETANSISTIMKACLVTGYGSKASAGWELAFEDLEKHVKVIKPAASPEQDYYLRLSKDDGIQLTPQVYTSMTDINTGDLKLQCATEFKYGAAQPTGRWTLIATDRAFWFFCETSNTNNIATKKSGSYFFCGDTKKNTAGHKAIYLKHTGGTWGVNDNDRYHLFEKRSDGATAGKLFDTQSKKTFETNPSSVFWGTSVESSKTMALPIFLRVNKETWELPAISPSRNDKENYDELHFDQRYLVHATASYGYETNLLIPLGDWG